MAWKSTLTPLRNRLAVLYPTEGESRRVVDEATLDPAHIAFNSQATNNWHNILSQADLHDKVQAIVWVALGQYRTDTQLIAAYEAYMTDLGRPATLPPLPAESAPTTTVPQHTNPLSQVTPHLGTQINTGGGVYIAGNVNTGGGDFVGRDKRTGNEFSTGNEAQEAKEIMQTLLAQHQRNLLQLQQKKAIYAAGEEPLSLLNQIAHEEQEIAKLKINPGLQADEVSIGQGDNPTNTAAPRPSRLTAMKRQRLQTTLDDLERQWTAVDQELRTNNDTVARDRLQLRLTQLEDDMAKAEAELEVLE